MEENKQIMGMLFDKITYHNQEQINNLIDGMTFEQSVFYITSALEYSVKSGLFELTEIEIISKSLRLLNQKVFEVK